MRRTVAAALALVVGFAAVPGCTRRSGASKRASVTVFAAASLTEAFSDGIAPLARHAGLAPTFNFAGSQALAAQIGQGAPADVFAAADETTAAKLAGTRRIEAPVVFAGNVLTIAVAPGNPKHVRGIADLGRSDLTVVLADPAVPAGNYSRQVLARAGVTVAPRSLELDVKAALARVERGDADATIVYTTDVRAAGARVSGVAIPAAANVRTVYPVAVVAGAAHQRAARAFVRVVLSKAGQRALTSRGFLPKP